jgi:hypothetical protein
MGDDKLRVIADGLLIAVRDVDNKRAAGMHPNAPIDPLEV